MERIQLALKTKSFFNSINRKYLAPAFFIAVLFICVSGTPFSAQQNSPKHASVEFFMKEYQKDFHPNICFSSLIFVSIKSQKLYLFKQGKVVAEYDVSTSKYGVGNQIHSKKTPVGLHQVMFKLGVGTPVGGIIKTGYYTGKTAEIIQEKKHGPSDHVTTRILWLDGLEKGINKGKNIDSHQRSIYIHGTPEEGLIGTPASHGCVRMRNKEVIHLFNMVKKGEYVLILDH